MQLKEQPGEWWEEYFGRKKIVGGKYERKIVGRKYGRDIVGGILWEEKRNTWKIGNEQGGRRD